MRHLRHFAGRSPHGNQPCVLKHVIRRVSPFRGFSRTPSICLDMPKINDKNSWRCTGIVCTLKEWCLSARKTNSNNDRSGFRRTTANYGQYSLTNAVNYQWRRNHHCQFASIVENKSIRINIFVDFLFLLTARNLKFCTISRETDENCNSWCCKNGRYIEDI